MIDIRERLRGGEILVGDGAMGTQLYARGLKQGESPESYNLSHPEYLEEIAAAYFNAGADVVQTNTFGATPYKLAMYDLADQTETINRAAVNAVRKAVGSSAYVSGSCGPTGAMLKPYGDIEPEQVYDSYRIQMEALVDAGVDHLCIETMIDLAEAKLALQAARELSASLPVMVTMTFNQSPRGYFTIMGNDIKTVVAELTAGGADLLGSNCGNGIDQMIEIATEFQKHTDLPLLIQANAGLPEIVDGRTVYLETPEFMAARVPALIRAGVGIVGGCCGTTPEHIKAFCAARTR
jgi:5-methyltetrahydrofolate--homocysteine methyltransferase